MSSPHSRVLQAGAALACLLVLAVVAIAGIGIQRVMGFTVITFAIAGFVYGAALLLLT